MIRRRTEKVNELFELELGLETTRLEVIPPLGLGELKLALDRPRSGKFWSHYV